MPAMGGIKFPCRPCSEEGNPSWERGEPLRAKTCQCGPLQRLDQDGLCSCGYWPKHTVDATWARQARKTGWAGPVSDLDVYRKELMQRQYGKAA